MVQRRTETNGLENKKGGKWLNSIEDSVNISIQRLRENIEKRRGRLITATGNNTDDTRTNRTEITRKQKLEEKQLDRRLKWHLTREKVDVAKKGNLKRETESILKAAQNDAIRTNHIKARIDKTQQNSRCKLCGDRDEMINHIISKCIKLAQKEYKTRHHWVCKMIYWELCKKFKFDHPNRWYIHNPESVLEIETHKLLYGFRDTKGSPNLGQTTSPYNNKKKRSCRIVDFAVPADPWVKLKESK